MKHPNSLSLRRRVALELWRKRMDIAVKEHPLRQLFWECTQRCNLHCRHCGSDCRAEVGVADMPLADFTRVLDSVALRTDPNRVFVVVTGGEPLMRHDIAECGAAIYEEGLSVGNGHQCVGAYAVEVSVVARCRHPLNDRQPGRNRRRPQLDARQSRQFPNGGPRH